MHYRRFKQKGGTYFFTVVTHQQQPIFAESNSVDLLRETMSQIKGKHPFEMDAIVVMPEHLHAIWTLPQDNIKFSMHWSLNKSNFSHEYQSVIEPEKNHSIAQKRERMIWQRRFWEHWIRDEND